MPSRLTPDADQNARSTRPATPTPVAVNPATEPAAPVKKSGKGAPAKAKSKDTTQAVLATTALPGITADERRALIARAAYLRAESRGFPPGSEAEDWLTAEKEVDALLRGGTRHPQ